MGPGWYPDPTGRQPLRWFDGTQWTPQTLDGWQRPVVDPLPPVDGTGSGTPSAAVVPSQPGTPPVAPPPTVGATTPPAASASPAPVVPGPAPFPEGVAAPAPGASPGPPGISTSIRWSQSWRLLVVAGAAVLMIFGFLMLPWIELGFGDRRVAIGYLDFTDWARANGVDVGGWRSAYADGLGLALAAIALVAASASAVATIVLNRTSGCVIPALLGVLALLCAAATPLYGIDDLPWDGPPAATQGSAPLLVQIGHVALALSSGEPGAKKTRRRGGSP